jgi:hypothetical protein
MKGDKQVCDYIVKDDMMWPKIVEFSDLKNECPVSKGKYKMVDFEYQAEVPGSFPKGDYKLRGYIKEVNKIKAAYEVSFTLTD